MELLAGQIREQLEDELGRVIDQALSGCRETSDPRDDGATRTPLTETIRQFVLAGGKRVRPQLCLWTYLQSRESQSPIPPLAMKVACAWELFHAFLLCHDDIIDKADRRRGQPTLHQRLASLDGGSMIFGANLGIVAGDLLFVGSMRLLHELDLDAASPPLSARTYQDLLRLFSRVGCETGFGQAIDILQSHVPLAEVDEKTVLRGYLWKTASYTFEGPMLSGALLAGLNADARAALSRFALAVGQAYQLHNDILDLRTQAHEGCDLVQGKRTPTLLRERARLAPACRSKFERRLEEIQRQGHRAVELAEDFRLELVAGGAVASTQQAVADLLTEAATAAQLPALPPRFAAALSGLLAGMSAEYFAPALM